MNADLLDYARQVLAEHDLPGWAVKWDRAKRRAGNCDYRTKTLSFSAPLARVLEAEIMRGVVLHEVAHALTGPGHGHDRVWRATAIRIGASPEARLPGSLPAPEPSWVGTCPRCHQQLRLYSAPRAVRSCGLCSSTFQVDLIFDWTRHGVPTQPGGAYAQKLRQTLRLVAASQR